MRIMGPLEVTVGLTCVRQNTSQMPQTENPMAFRAENLKVVKRTSPTFVGLCQSRNYPSILAYWPLTRSTRCCVLVSTHYTRDISDDGYCSGAGRAHRILMRVKIPEDSLDR